MGTYKLTYVDNVPLSPQLVNRIIEGQYIIEYNKGYLIYAFVRADNSEEAKKIGTAIGANYRQMYSLLAQ